MVPSVNFDRDHGCGREGLPERDDDESTPKHEWRSACPGNSVRQLHLQRHVLTGRGIFDRHQLQRIREGVQRIRIYCSRAREVDLLRSNHGPVRARALTDVPEVILWVADKVTMGIGGHGSRVSSADPGQPKEDGNNPDSSQLQYCPLHLVLSFTPSSRSHRAGLRPSVPDSRVPGNLASPTESGLRIASLSLIVKMQLRATQSSCITGSAIWS